MGKRVLAGKSLINVVSVNGIVASGCLEGRVVVREARQRERNSEREIEGCDGKNSNR